jgi:thioredoxin-like negative regulator of GroEL
MLQPPPPTRQSSLDFAPPVSNPFDAAALSLTMLLCGIRTLADAQIAGDATTVADASALAELRQLRRAAETACDRLCEHLNGTTNIY